MSLCCKGFVTFLAGFFTANEVFLEQVAKQAYCKTKYKMQRLSACVLVQ